MTRLFRFSRAATGLTLLCVTACADGCRGEDLSFDCENQAMAFIERADAESPPLVTPVPEGSPYPVALQLTEQGVKDLFDRQIDAADVPFTGKTQILAYESTFYPDVTEEKPIEIQLEDLPWCPNCIVLSMSYYVEMVPTGLDAPPLTGIGDVQLAIPLVLQTDEVTGISSILADYSQTAVNEFTFNLFGEGEDHGSLVGALQILLEEQIREEYEPISLLDIGSWEIGNGEVRLLARSLRVYPEADKLVIGMKTNLDLPDSAVLDLTQPLPEETPMALSMHPGVFLAMSHRMLAEGEIPRRYDEDGEPDDEGTYAVTLHSMQGSAAMASQLDTRFRVWRIAEGYCGYAEADMALKLEVNEPARQSFSVLPGDAVLVEDPENCQGSGCVAQEEKQIVEDNQDIVENFRTALAEQVGQTLNFDSLDIDGSVIVFFIQNLAVSPDVIQTNLDFTVVAEN
jgi:hypothetical protein